MQRKMWNEKTPQIKGSQRKGKRMLRDKMLQLKYRYSQNGVKTIQLYAVYKRKDIARTEILKRYTRQKKKKKRYTRQIL